MRMRFPQGARVGWGVGWGENQLEGCNGNNFANYKTAKFKKKKNEMLAPRTWSSSRLMFDCSRRNAYSVSRRPWVLGGGVSGRSFAHIETEKEGEIVSVLFFLTRSTLRLLRENRFLHAEFA